jgi:hypothetical protein
MPQELLRSQVGASLFVFGNLAVFGVALLRELLRLPQVILKHAGQQSRQTDAVQPLVVRIEGLDLLCEFDDLVVVQFLRCLLVFRVALPLFHWLFLAGHRIFICGSREKSPPMGGLKATGGPRRLTSCVSLARHCDRRVTWR